MLVTTAPEMPPEYTGDTVDYLLKKNTTVIISDNINREDPTIIKDFARTFVEEFGEPWACEWPERAFSELIFNSLVRLHIITSLRP